MVKRILIPLDPSPYTDMAIDMGCLIAKQTKAELTGLVVLDIHGIEHSIGPVPAGAWYYAHHLEKAKEEEALDRIHMLINKFKSKCDKEGVAHREAESQGVPSEKILKMSVYFDVVMFGLKTYFHFETQEEPGDTIQKVLEQAITPIYAVPAEMKIPDVPKEKIKVLIPYNGSMPAARALHHFVRLAQPDLMVVKMIISTKDKDEADYYLNNAEAFLRSHKIKSIEKIRVDKNIISAVDEDFIDWSDVIVVGANSKKSILDFMVGSLTKHLMKEAKEMLLISQ